MNHQDVLAPVTPQYAEPLRLLQLSEVVHRTGRAKSRIYADIRAGTFPKPVKDGRSARWDSRAIEAWITALLAPPAKEGSRMSTDDEDTDDENTVNSSSRASSPESFAQRHSLSLPTVRRKIGLGEIPAHKFGRRVLITDEDERVWLESLPRVQPRKEVA